MRYGLAWVFVSILVAGCSKSAAPGDGGCAQPAGSRADIVVLTIIPEEYRAIVDRLRTSGVASECPQCADRYAWVRAEVKTGRHTAPYRLVVGLAAEPGTTSGALMAAQAIELFAPRHLLLVGVAGGLPEQARRGDVVVSDSIWGYDYGSLDSQFHPRLDFTYRTDSLLLEAARSLATDWQSEIRAKPPEPGTRPRRLIGATGSGNKVIETLESDFVARLFEIHPRLISLEMEGAGAAAAVEGAREQGHAVGLLMIRGISDIPAKPLLGDKPDREKWKAYAADSAATFAHSLIRDAWPIEPGAAACVP